MDGGHNAAAAAPALPPSRWKSAEYVFYAGFLTYIYWLAFGIVMAMSNEFTGPNAKGLNGLRPGWIFGRHVDLRDQQYSFFRENLPLLTSAAVAFLVLSYVVRSISNNSFRARLAYYALFSTGFLLFVNGSSFGFMLIIITFNFLISKLSAVASIRIAVPFITWAFNLGVLMSNEYYHGYTYRKLFGDTLGWLDNYRHGLFPWQNLFNLVVLRMISYNMDYHWFVSDKRIVDRDGKEVTFSRHAGIADQPGGCEHCKQHGQLYACAWWREKSHQPVDSYSFVPYFVYLFYVPLHLAGPTTTFNNFTSHVRHAQRTHTPLQLAAYVARLVGIILLMEVMLHYLYCFAISEGRVWSVSNYSPAQVSLLGYFTLKTMWLKFLIIWRFFRAWALLDGVEAPENMNRCMSNNYSLQGFWRSWHRSFNRWLVRYIYVPLGGSRGVVSQIVNTFMVFGFVAFWHDRTMQLASWGLFIAAAFAPELILNWWFSKKRNAGIVRAWYWRHLKGAAAAVCIFAMMVANLIGYSVGLEGTRHYLSQILTWDGVGFVGLIFLVFFSAAQLMFEIRADEERRGTSNEF